VAPVRQLFTCDAHEPAVGHVLRLLLTRAPLLLPCVQRMANNEPPLIIMYSNPKKIKLTSDGIALAAYFYKVGAVDGPGPV
jgi:hypothetical protein